MKVSGIRLRSRTSAERVSLAAPDKSLPQTVATAKLGNPCMCISLQRQDATTGAGAKSRKHLNPVACCTSGCTSRPKPTLACGSTSEGRLYDARSLLQAAGLRVFVLPDQPGYRARAWLTASENGRCLLS